ncbi:MAG: LicD family protein [Methanomassiliicoccales archaeon PtaB.Bin215]|nr:MAG: LicD family protein [Methanomassiliicoccales archaeon PtaB.Bin215]
MNELQQVQLSILQEMDRVCRKNGIRYFLFSGTLLGAVRHKGFIPWDDDIDVVLLRDEYERFVGLPPEEFGPNFFLQTSDTDLEYNNVYAKVRRSDTTYVESYMDHKRINHGVFIDVFPLDGVPSNRFLQTIFWYPISVLGYTASLKAFKKEPKPHLIFPFVLLKTLSPLSGGTLMKAYGKLMGMFDIGRTQKVGFLTHAGFPLGHVVYEKSWFDRTVDLEYEGLSFPAPGEHHKVLTQLFGEYMNPPPEDKRVSHHGATLIDLELPYQEAIHEI